MGTKRRYNPPQLVVYGSLAELTQLTEDLTTFCTGSDWGWR